MADGPDRHSMAANKNARMSGKAGGPTHRRALSQNSISAFESIYNFIQKIALSNDDKEAKQQLLLMNALKNKYISDALPGGLTSLGGLPQPALAPPTISSKSREERPFRKMGGIDEGNENGDIDDNKLEDGEIVDGLLDTPKAGAHMRGSSVVINENEDNDDDDFDDSGILSTDRRGTVIQKPDDILGGSMANMQPRTTVNFLSVPGKDDDDDTDDKKQENVVVTLKSGATIPRELQAPDIWDLMEKPQEIFDTGNSYIYI